MTAFGGFVLLERAALVEYDTSMSKGLKNNDRQLFFLLTKEQKRQNETLDLIASENYAPGSVLKLLGSELTNKYSEGYPGKRYYPGNKIYDKIELLAQKRALELFKLSSKRWQVNVQPYSGAIANLAIYSAVLRPGDKILSLSLSSGGHLSHGSKVSFSGKIFDVTHYNVDKNYEIDYPEIAFLAKKIRPKIIVSGASAYPKEINFEKIGQIAKKVGAYHLADISHYAGLISAKKYPSPFKKADFVMTTTHKSLFGPRAAVIYVNRDSKVAKANKIDLAQAVDKAVFPGLQGGPHNNTIAAIACGLKIATSPKAKRYYVQVAKNAKTLCSQMKKMGFDIVGGGTESHLFLVKTTSLGMNGFEAEKLLEKAGILANRNTIMGDSSPIRPSAIRIGTYAVTARGMKEREMKKIAGLIKDVLINNQKSSKVFCQVKNICARFKI
jgi:glycine hydroxymethyltransferase